MFLLSGTLLFVSDGLHPHQRLTSRNSALAEALATISASRKQRAVEILVQKVFRPVGDDILGHVSNKTNGGSMKKPYGFSHEQHCHLNYG